MALKLTLSPKEKLVVNGAVIQNGERRANVVIQNKAAILREKDIMMPDEATTPMRRIYFAIMMMYLEESSVMQYRDLFNERIAEFMQAIRHVEVLSICKEIIALVQDEELYKALMHCRRLYDFEEARLNYVSPELSTSTERN